jgi:parallel beta-helix repeat protein
MDGDLILVGPGRYENQEGPGACMVSVSKSLTIASLKGAEVTVLDGSSPSPADEVVCITASNTVFGWPSRGFTIMGATSFGLHIHSTDVERVQIMGNIAINNSRGFGIEGVGKHTLKGNLALDNSQMGFWIFSSGTAVVGNVATSNGLNGFRVFGGNHRLSGNLAVSNQIGFEIDGGGHVMKGNSAIGNVFDGVRIPNGGEGVVSLQRNNIYGNHSAPDANAPEAATSIAVW